MTTTLTTLSLQTRSASIALALAMAAGNCLAQDSAAASFERMFSHQPATHQPVTAAQRDADPLVAALVVPLRDGVQRAPAFAAADPVAQSFARLFAHQPHATAPALPAGSATDPLVAALIEPLRDGHGSAAASLRLASATR
ncbi:MAG: hypothetical protein IPG91_23450 [Ideonella sp.]|nr:hypothetical protein [Ideonella sp.]